ncbi:hypothetical protein BU16DRAFT_66127 [Lophium mytilinum]|uniref:Uncharacterized protein n=1 Tax=Lophium mytilinum TaxID=390894 RepID=A0A6A6QP31_9PEZI|nr:hypothetical protein BU16DRAFT_66127 [Lophium mytilinum]
MYRQIYSLGLSILTLLLLLPDTLALKLFPVSHPDDLTGGQHGHQKRQWNHTESLDLQDFETFYWGGYSAGDIVYANLTLYFTGDYENIISMERFAGMLKSVDCSDHMMLEFKDNTSFAYAQRVWNWVNNDVNNTFVMIANYEGCGPAAERQPFTVTNIVYDAQHSKAFLTADQKNWTEIAHTYSLSVGHTPAPPPEKRLALRGDPDFSMNLASSFNRNFFSTTAFGVDMSLDCSNCGTSGSLNVDFDIDVALFKISSAKMTISPKDVAAFLEVSMSESGTLSSAYNWEKTIVSIPIDGIEIAKIVKLGAFLDVDVGFSMAEWEGEAHATMGARMTLPNSAIVVVDLVKSENNQFSGWMPDVVPIPLQVSAKVEGSAEIFAEPKIKLTAKALGKGFEVGLNLKLPDISADFTAMFDSTGVCGGLHTLGVDVNANVGVDLSVQAATAGNEANPFWTQELYVRRNSQHCNYSHF